MAAERYGSSEAEQLVVALSDREDSVEFIVFDEGYGIAKFLDRVLGTE